jgi:hypothetical protein
VLSGGAEKNPKRQIPNAKEIPSFRTQISVVDDWSFFGAWSLASGISE